MIHVRDQQDQRFLDWVRVNFRETIGLDVNFDKNTCLTKAIDRDKKELLAVVVFHDFIPGHRMEMSIASADPKWCNRKVLFNCFDYCFNICEVNRIYTQVMGNNPKALEMNKRLGFREMAVLPGFTVDIDGKAHDNHVFSMNKKECRWIIWPKVGEEA